MFQRRLSHIKKMSLSAPEISEARFKKFTKELGAYEQQLVYARTLDSFLDLYSSWKAHHSQALKLRLVMLAFELHRLNSNFRCDLSFDETK